MRLILVITGLLLFMESVNVFQWVQLTDPETAFVYDPDAEEEKKAESETETAKFDKNHHYFSYTLALIFKSQQSAYEHTTGRCLDGHPTTLYQPPDA